MPAPPPDEPIARSNAGDPAAAAAAARPLDFIREIVEADLASGKHAGVVTRFPPEPNGYLHIGHAKSICLNFGVAAEHGGRCHLRFDDTNPETEDPEYVGSIQDDVRWLGFDWGEHLYYASDYFERFYQAALHLVREGKAYVDSSSDEEIRAYRGTVTEPGRPSPYRDRPVEENLDLFTRMRAGEFSDGAHVLRARIDMAAANMKMRDPLLFRIRHAHHYRCGDAWPIYPMYDFAHPLSDAYERITHSLCTLEFENNRELYDWVVANCPVPAVPRQIEFARLNLTYTVLSKRWLLALVEGGWVAGWDDPRMPTVSGLRRRGVTPEAIRDFCDRVGVAKSNSTVDVAMLDHSVRDDLNTRAPRVLAVLRPLKVVIVNYPAQADQPGEETLDAPFWPHDVPREGSRELPFSRELYIERDDFAEHPPKGFRRLAPGREVRLRYAYFIRCEEVVKDDRGEPVELRCTYDPATRGGASPDGRSPAGTIHWVSAAHARPVTVRLYDRLFRDEYPAVGKTGGRIEELLDPDSLEVIEGALVEPAAAAAAPGDRLQFERHGYFFADPVDSAPGAPVFNRIVPLRDTWARRAAGGSSGQAAGTDTGSAGGQAGRASGAGGRRAVRGGAPGAGAAPSGAADEPRIRPAEGAGKPPLPDVPPEKRGLFELLQREHGLGEQDAAIVATDETLTRLFDEAVAALPDPRAIANWLVNDLRRELKEREIDEPRFGGAELAELIRLVDRGEISTAAAKEVLGAMVAGEGGAAEIVATRGLGQVSDPAQLAAVVDEVLAAHPGEAEAYRAGKSQLLGFFIGQAMRATRGRANPEVLREVLRARLS